MDGIASILVVDDNPKFLADALPMYGYNVTVACRIWTVGTL